MINQKNQNKKMELPKVKLANRLKTFFVQLSNWANNHTPRITFSQN